MAQSAPVEDDSFLDDVDDSFLDEVEPSNEYGLGFQKVGAPDEQDPISSGDVVRILKWAKANPGNPRARAVMPKLLEMEASAKSFGHPTIAKVNKAGFDGATFGHTDEAIGLINKDSGDAFRKDVKDFHEESPWLAGLSGAAGGLPAGMLINPASSALAKAAAGSGAGKAALLRVLGMAGDGAVQGALTGHGNSEATGLDTAGDTATGAGIGAAIGGAVGGVSEGASALLRKFMGRGGGAAAEAAPMRGVGEAHGEIDLPLPEQVPDNVVPIRPPAEDVGTKITPKWKTLGFDEYGGSGGGYNKNKDPEFLRKSKELADMLEQGDDGTVRAKMPKDVRNEQKLDWQEALDRGDESQSGHEGYVGPRYSAADKQAMQDAWVGPPPADTPPMEVPVAASPDDVFTKPKGRVALEEVEVPDAISEEAMQRYMAEVNAQGAGRLQAKQPDMFDEALRRMSAREPIDVPAWEGETAVTEAPWMPKQRAPLQSREPIDPGNIFLPPQAASKQSKPGFWTPERAQQVGEWAGGAVGAAATGGNFLGVEGGKRLGKMIAGKLTPESMAQKLVANPAMLQKIAAGGGKMSGAARFILQGAQEGGEAGLKARAFVAAAMPSMRELFGEQEPAR